MKRHCLGFDYIAITELEKVSKNEKVNFKNSVNKNCEYLNHKERKILLSKAKSQVNL